MRFTTFRSSRVPALASIGTLFLFFSAPGARAYSVLTHEALIDTIWDTSIKPLLLKKYPGSTSEQLVAAHAYAYGGGIIQDVGYYPFGSHLFSDLTHYVRSGDFVQNLFSEARNLNEYAFSIGALAHYDADNNGHPIAINATVPMLYPKLRIKYGPEVTYVDDPTAHIRTEFGFDVLQVARGHYPSQAYHDFIGFQVSKELLDRACEDTYGLKLKDIFETLDLALGTYRWSVSNLIPEMTRAAWAAKKRSILEKNPGITRQTFIFNMSRSSYRKEWGNDYERPGFGARSLALLFRLIPKVGPFKSLGFRTPAGASELLFEKSFDATVDQDKADLMALSSGTLNLRNKDLDTGKLSRIGEYPLADKTYDELIKKLAEKKEQLSPALKANIEEFESK
ncbi:MAG: zinc dependent phospholipase C family protein [Acidobacteriota bacterium]|nr:zinc dependent phospholipase C family protein [Acidobacteriota bacterium]